MGRETNIKNCNILCMAYTQNGGHLKFLGDSISLTKILIPV